MGPGTGSLEAGKRADLVVVDGTTGDPYRALLRANEARVRLVMVNGVARFGMLRIMGRLGAKGERITVGGRARLVFTDHPSADPVVAQITLAEAERRLTATLRGLGRDGTREAEPAPAVFASDEPQWFLALDEVVPSGIEVPAPAALRGGGDGAARDGCQPSVARAAPLPLVPLDLDPLTAVDDRDFLRGLGSQLNLPAGLAEELAELYR